MKLPEMYLGDIDSGLTGPSFRRRVQFDGRERATIKMCFLQLLCRSGPGKLYPKVVGTFSSRSAGNVHYEEEEEGR